MTQRTAQHGTWRPSPNFGPRKNGLSVDMIVLHYTGMTDGEKAVEWLCTPESQVSSHYLVHDDGRIVQMVDEDMRAWHAGLSHWRGVDDINSCSIGIEIQNPGHELGYPEFPPKQMQAVAELCRGIILRHDVPALRVLAHSDVAPLRKIDPGEKFNWRWLAGEGVGLWREEALLPLPQGRIAQADGAPDDSASFVRRLMQLGYGPLSGETNGETAVRVIEAFQRHWRPARVDGCWDHQCDVILSALLAHTPVDDSAGSPPLA